MTNVQPYLLFAGNCEEAIKFYCDVFGGEIQYAMKYKDAPKSQGMDIPANMSDKIMHLNFIICGEQLMASDSGMGPAPVIGNNIHLSVNFDKKTKIDDFFNKLAQGGKVNMPLQNTFWGARFGMLSDRFGVNWMFNQNLEEKV